MAELLQQMEAQERSARGAPGEGTGFGPRRGTIIEGTIASIDRDGILIDIGTKAEGEVAQSELPELLASPEPPKVGDKVLAFVLRGENREGRVLLSLTRGREERGWRQMELYARDNVLFEAAVTEANRGGLVVDARGVRGFVPMSQVASVRIGGATEEEVNERLQSMIGQTIPLKVVEVQQRRGRLILSERLATQEMRNRTREELINQLQEGEIRRGRVTSVTDFGAFVDIGGADGLVHLSEMSWTRVGKASDVVQAGDEIDVMVIGVDRDRKKIGLSLRRTQPEPWALAAETYYPGQIVEGTVTRLAAFGAFAQLDDGLEGLIHVSELSDQRISNPRQAVTEGERRRMRVLRVEPERRRLALSLRNVPLVDDYGNVAEAYEPEQDYSAGYTTASTGGGGGGGGQTLADHFAGWNYQPAAEGEEEEEDDYQPGAYEQQVYDPSLFTQPVEYVQPDYAQQSAYAQEGEESAEGDEPSTADVPAEGDQAAEGEHSSEGEQPAESDQPTEGDETDEDQPRR